MPRSVLTYLAKLTPVVAKSLERSEAKALKEVLPSWQKYTGRYVLTDPNAIRTVTSCERPSFAAVSPWRRSSSG